MIYNANTEAIMGVTYSCYQSLGIPASLVYGNSQNTSEFTIDQIAPDINDPKNLDDLRSPQGLTVTIDTTFIQTNFLLDEEESEGDSERDEYDLQNSQLQAGNDNSAINGAQNATHNGATNGAANATTIGATAAAESMMHKRSRFKKTRVR
jgi:hypothetical protein